MKLILSSFFAFVVLLGVGNALQVTPHDIFITNTTHEIKLYLSEPVRFDTSCPNWLSFHSSSTTLLFTHNQNSSYDNCVIDLYSLAQPVGVRLAVFFADVDFELGVSNMSTAFTKPLADTSGVQLRTVDLNQTDMVSADFTGEKKLKVSSNTLWSVVFVLFFVSVLFLLLPKT